MGKCAFRCLRLAMVLLALTGLGLSCYLLYLHYGTRQGGLAKRLCGGSFDCAAVLQSRWGYFHLGPVPIPIALLGMGYFVVLAVWLITVGRLPGRLHHSCVAPALLATVGALDSGYLIYVMGERLHTWCGFCLAVHAVNFLLFIGLWTQWAGGCGVLSDEELAAARARQIWKVPALAMANAVLIGVTLLALFGFGFMFKMYYTAAWEVAKVQQDAGYQRWKYSQTAPTHLPLTAGAPVIGVAHAPHTVVMFGDFQCPTCAETDRMLKKVQEAMPGEFRLVFRNFPLNHACNQAIDKGKAGHAFACMAAEAAEAARRLGGDEAFWRMHDELYKNQRRLDEKPYSELAKDIGLDPDALAAEMFDPTIHDQVEQDAALGKKLGIEAVPVIFLDGRRLGLDVVENPKTQEPDVAATIKHWQALLAAADQAAATQPLAQVNH